jgi:threonine dehydratase
MRYVWERMKLVIEPSAAVVVAAARVARLDGARVGIVLSGGNVDVDALPW